MCTSFQQNETVAEILEEHLLQFIHRPAVIDELLTKALKESLPEKIKTNPKIWPPDFVLENVSAMELRAMLHRAVANPKTNGQLDPFTALMYNLQKDNAWSPEQDQISPVNWKKHELEYDTHGIFRIPCAHECPQYGPHTQTGKMLKSLLVDPFKSGILDRMAIYDPSLDPSGHQPCFWDSEEECALYFYALFRPYYPPTIESIGTLNLRKQVDCDITAHVFSSWGQYYIKAIEGNGKSATWPGRAAGEKCVPPPGSVCVVDVSHLARLGVRPDYEPYGDAAFFDAQRLPLGYWSEWDGRLVTEKSSEDWQWAEWRFKNSLFYESFAVSHITDVHWIVSNTLVTAALQGLEAAHPLQRFIAPFIHGTVTINRAAVVKLAGRKGVLVRQGGCTPEGCVEHLHNLAMEFNYQIFGDFLASKGKFPAGFLESLPMVQDGKMIWGLYSNFVRKFLAMHYRDDKSSQAGRAVGEDPEIVSFWALADRACFGTTRSFGLPELTFSALADYLTYSFFWATAIHALRGGPLLDMMMVHGLGGHIMKRQLFIKYNKNPQLTVQCYFRNMGTLISTIQATPRTPDLIPSMYEAANFYADAKAPYGENKAMADLYTQFARDLEAAAAEIDKSNLKRGDLAFGAFNPKVFRCSVSL